MKLATPDDSELVQEAKAGSYPAFETLVRRYERKVYNVAYRLAGNRADAEDILQETFLKAFENLKRFRGDSSFYTWIMKIAVNATLIRFRRGVHTRSVSLDELNEGNQAFHPEALHPGDFHPQVVISWDSNPEQRYSRKENELILRRAIQRLPAVYRTVFWLRDVEQFSNAEVARMLKLSVFAVKSRLMRARLELRERLTAYYGKKGAKDELQNSAHEHV